MMPFLVYNLVLLVLSPAIALFVLYRVFISGKSRKSWRQQLGGVDIPEGLRGRELVWIHAVSVGESVASAAVVSELKSALPDVAVLVSTTTETGQEMARKSVKDADGFLYYPFDLLPCVRRAIGRVRPRVFASTDTEMWPNFRHVAREMGVRSAVINGTVSDKTIAGAKKVPWLYRWTLSNIDLFCMQSEADAERIVALGAEPSRVIVTGNCKADQAVIPMSDAAKDELRSRFKLSRDVPVFVAGSTNPGEDEPVLDAFLAARKRHPDLRAIIAPRQVERREEIAELAVRRGLTCGWRSDPASIAGGEDVLLLDTLGELAEVYAIADVTFVGGSLIPRGCHSILQPIAQGKPVFFGPYTFKAKDLVAQAKAAGVGFEIADAGHLGSEIIRMLSDRALLEEIQIRCERMMAANIGASKRTADALARLYRGLAPKDGG
jgi:3-deoxy-D-manno-octulosonic-acid transferase